MHMVYKKFELSWSLHPRDTIFLMSNIQSGGYISEHYIFTVTVVRVIITYSTFVIITVKIDHDIPRIVEFN